MKRERYHSIIQSDTESCYLCGRNGCGDPLDWHHVFGGSDKKRSEKYGLMIRVCHKRCHIFDAGAIHVNKDVRLAVQEEAQAAYEEIYGDRASWMAEFGKNYIYEDVKAAV